ncbi:PEP-utilizing enzyme [Spirillospora sp. NPDC047418]
MSPADTAALDTAAVLALVTERGGPTGHTAILARSLGLPLAGVMVEVPPPHCGPSAPRCCGSRSPGARSRPGTFSPPIIRPRRARSPGPATMNAGRS